MQCVVSIMGDFNSSVFQLMSISKKYTDYGDNLSSETTIRGEIDIDTLLQTYAYTHTYTFLCIILCLYVCFCITFVFILSRIYAQKLSFLIEKKREKKHVSKKRVSKYDVLFQNCIALSSKMSSNGACLYEDGGIEGGHIPSYLLLYVRLRFHVYMFIPEN